MATAKSKVSTLRLIFRCEKAHAPYLLVYRTKILFKHIEDKFLPHAIKIYCGQELKPALKTAARGRLSV
jgi:hypothetical protein